MSPKLILFRKEAFPIGIGRLFFVLDLDYLRLTMIFFLFLLGSVAASCLAGSSGLSKVL